MIRSTILNSAVLIILPSMILPTLSHKEIRMRILLNYYRAAEERAPAHDIEGNKELERANPDVYDFNYGYLVDSGLLNGEQHHSWDGVPNYVDTGGITSKGIDVVEEFIDMCVEITPLIKEKTISSYASKIVELFNLWASNSGLLASALELLPPILQAVNQ